MARARIRSFGSDGAGDASIDVSSPAMSSDHRAPEDDLPPATHHDPEAEDRAAILRRRAMFVASAIAGLGLASSCGETGAGPRACLDVSIPEQPAADAGAPDAAADAEEPLIQPNPQPCLGGAPRTPSPLDAGTPDGGKRRPGPCLKIAPPRPCLDMPAPDNDDG
jgi:hypothetical protein